MFASKVFAAIALVGFASAATSTSTASGCSQPTLTIDSQAAASSIASCTTFTGDIVVDPSVGATLALDGIQQLTGSLTVNGATNMTTLSAADMNAISGTMMLNDLTVLSSLQFPVLKSIGTINWVTLPALQSLTFSDTVDQCDSVTISDTQLSSLEGIDLNTVQQFIISENRFLKTINTRVANITGSLDIGSNGEDLAVEFPNLLWAGNMTFRNTSSVTMQSLANVTGFLFFGENFFSGLSAPNLTLVEDVLTFVANPSLSNISLNALTTVGGLEIANNTDLIDITGFTSLKTVTGALDVTGNYTDAPFAALTRVDGAFHMVSSGNFSCAHFETIQSQDFLGTYTCTPTSNNVQSGTGTGSSSGSSSSGTKKGAAGQLDIPTSFGLVGGLLAMLL